MNFENQHWILSVGVLIDSKKVAHAAVAYDERFLIFTCLLTCLPACLFICLHDSANIPSMDHDFLNGNLNLHIEHDDAKHVHPPVQLNQESYIVIVQIRFSSMVLQIRPIENIGM